jgi:magnesium dechelatase
MSDLLPEKLHVTLQGGTPVGEFSLPRRYTLTHSDLTGDLFLTIGAAYDHRQISGIYTRLMRDAVLAEWQKDRTGPSLHVYCHVSGGLAIGSAHWRNDLLLTHMRSVIEALYHGDRDLAAKVPELAGARVWVHFGSNEPSYDRVEDWGLLRSYKLE